MLVLFDIDDTLLDHRAAERAAAIALHDAVGRPGVVDLFVSTWSDALEHYFALYLRGELSFPEQRRARIRHVVDAALTDADADRLLELYLAQYLAAVSAFPDAQPCLDRLARAGHRLGVISNGQGVMQRHKLGLAGLVDRFDCIVISEECGCAKPAAEIFLQACRDANEPATNALYVGDRYDLDAEGARGAGLRGVWLDRAGRAADRHVPPIVRGLDELADLVDAHSRQREVIA